MKKIILVIFISTLAFACDDSLNQTPVALVTDDLAVTDEASANQVLLGAYNALQSANSYGNLEIGMKGILSDELIHSGSFPTIKQLDQSDCQVDNVTIRGYWATHYNGIYVCNTLLERIEKVKIDQVKKDQIVGQAKFIRALLYFNLTNLFGGVPLALTSEIAANSKLDRTSRDEIYAFVITELTTAATLLKGVDYGTAGRDSEDRNRAGEWAAKALLARAQLYAGSKSAAGATANDVITNGGYTLSATYVSIFNGNSSETIFEVFSSANDQNGLAFQFRGSTSGGRYEYAPSPQLIAAMVPADARRAIIANIASANPEAAKYKDVATGTDRPIVSRLSEMYLIRAEGAIGTAQADADINLLRQRAGLPTKTNVTIGDVLSERFVELCFEGHRWNDLIRTGSVNQVMSVINPTTWNANKALLPIPLIEIQQNPTLAGKQNPGY